MAAVGTPPCAAPWGCARRSAEQVPWRWPTSHVGGMSIVKLARELPCRVHYAQPERVQERRPKKRRPPCWRPPRECGSDAARARGGQGASVAANGWLAAPPSLPTAGRSGPFGTESAG